MLNKQREAYEVEDFLTDESFTNYHFRLNRNDESSWSQWLKQNPDKDAVVKQARELIDTLSLSISDSEYTLELNKIRNAISDNTTDPGFYLLQEKTSPNTVPRKKWLPLALVVLAGMIGAGFFLFHNRQAATPQFAETVNNQQHPVTIILSDSTVVTLEPQSTLQYPQRFPADHRNVYLKGEAQFSVKRNENAPFKVFSENIVATVLGTVFNFKKGSDSSTVVELLKGKLQVQANESSGSTSSIILYPNEKAVYMKRAHALYKNSIEVRANITFQQNSFSEIAARLKDAFGITVINKSKKVNWRFTGTFKNATSKEVIDNICFIKNLTASVKADTIYINNR